MTRTFRVLAAPRVLACALAAGIALALAGCGGEAPPQAPAPAPAPSAAATTAAAPTGPSATGAAGDQDVVRTTVTEYNASLLARDFPKACTLNAPETNEGLINTLKARGVQVTSCVEAFQAIFAVPGTPETIDEIARTTKISAVRVEGDQAFVTFTASTQGQTKTNVAGLRKVDGQWRMLPVQQ
ncbi:hypothetical protein [Pseudonocardia sp. TRM90224]|uniref:hypothetical protein n=1 Tax=Pseudonocardia sp. TRM90224 TaxID=2812678 RepID=UPI001E45DABF|nr:hypothetical protein [Pseudonocardia sp. TRM90224]